MILLAPHNDDEVLFGTWTLLRHQPEVIICLRSERMAQPSYPGYPDFAVSAETREAETDAAMNVLGCEWRQWAYTDARPDWHLLEQSLRQLESVDHVFAPAVERWGHEHHNTIGFLALKVFGTERVTPYLTYTHVGGKSVHGQEVPYEAGWPDLKRRAMSCYESQARHPMTSCHFNGDIREFYAR